MAAVKDDRLGQMTGLNVAAPLRVGADGDVREAIEAIRDDAGSPFARLGTVHFARWVLIEQAPREDVTTLWFSATFDGTRERFISGLARHMPDELDAVFAHCVDWPGARERDAFERWVLARRVAVTYFLSAYPDATLPQITRALARRRALAELAVDARGMNGAQLRAAFAERLA
jgi:hypothetical protein